MLLVALAVALALLIALPLGVAVQGRPRLARLVLGLANAVQTIPSLAIFGLLLTVPLLGGIGPTPAVVYGSERTSSTASATGCGCFPPWALKTASPS